MVKARAKPGWMSHLIGTLNDAVNFPLYEPLHHLRQVLVEPFAQHRPQHFQYMIFDGAPGGQNLLGI